jgi:hypothetical protein
MYRPFLFAALVFTACAGETAPAPSLAPGAPSVDRAAPLAGVPDRGDDPAVVALAMPGRAPCAGGLLAPDVLFTAGRCVPAPVQALRVYSGDEPTGAVERARGAKVLASPGGDADVALVLIDAAVDDLAPLAVRTTGVARGDHVRTVGFRADGKVVRDHVPVLASNDHAFDVAEESCVVGRGGLALDESTGEVAGVLTSGAPDCVPGAGRDVYARADRALAAVADALAQAARGTAKGARKTKKGPIDMGAGCAHGAQCAAGACVSNGGAEYCSRTCDGHDSCPARFKCMNTQQELTVCVER